MDTIVLDNGIEYVIVKEEIINGTVYTLFSNIDDDDICIRKTVIEDGEEYYTGLDNDNEFELVMASFAKSFLKGIDN